MTRIAENLHAEENVLELIYKIDGDRIVNLKEGNFSHYRLDEENINDDNIESLKSNSAYKAFSNSLKALQLSSMIKKVNIPKINQTISIYSHESDLLMQSIALDIAFLLKPLLNLSVNIIKDNSEQEEEKLQIVKNYLDQNLKQIKNQTIKKFLSSMSGKKKKEESEENSDDSKEESLKKIANNKKFSEIKENLQFFNDSLINHLMIWIKISLKNSSENDLNMKPQELKAKISQIFDEFFEKSMDEIFKRVQF